MCKENLALYEQFRKCPEEAQKTIQAGRLKGMTDINPMWRIKKLTEVFGPCGFGWTVKIVRTWIEEGNEGERTANVQIALRVKYNGEWSEPIEGIGGAMFIATERNGMHTDDECFKKAYTDAISVACKSLGIAADIYWNKDTESKYGTVAPQPDPTPYKCVECGAGVTENMAARTQKAFGVLLCKDCGLKRSGEAMKAAQAKAMGAGS